MVSDEFPEAREGEGTAAMAHDERTADGRRWPAWVAASHGLPPRLPVPPRRREDGGTASAYAWRRDPASGVVVVVDLDAPDRRSVTNDAEGVAADLAALLGPSLAAMPLVPYRDSSDRWDAALSLDPLTLEFAGYVSLGDARSEGEAVARAVALLAAAAAHAARP